ncbi:MAG: PIN domain-containing protein [Candidatus Woesearchaeota archaeon]
MNSYFLDTYALIEILKENKNYEKYKKGIFITTKLNLLELHYYLIRTTNEDVADEVFEDLEDLCVDISSDVYLNASRFKYLNKKKKLSFVDCISYLIARQENISFLTGDNAFEGFVGVEFVK